MSKDRLFIAQWLLIGTGCALLLVWAGAWVHAQWNSHRDVAAFEAARAASQQQAAALAESRANQAPKIRSELSSSESGTGPAVSAMPQRLPDPAQPDTADWSPARIEHYQASLDEHTGLPEALLRIPVIDLEVPVITGTDELTLNRAVGRIPGTARLRGPGNLGLAGHRDGFFRGLKDVAPGDLIELVTLEGNRTYSISEIWIVDPSDISVLAATDKPSITLVTCYPFYFVGHAPQRYIVRAELTEDAEAITVAGPG
ncbi:MAG: class D sortase [Gammaproteobacteria bacterium]